MCEPSAGLDFDFQCCRCRMQPTELLSYGHPANSPRYLSKTDHGYTWVERIWYEKDGKRISPLIPSAGCCERLGSMPGGPVRCDFVREEKLYAPEGVTRTEKTEEIHDDGFYRVNSVSIYRDPNR